MDSRTRFRNTHLGKPVDRPWLAPDGLWARTEELWRQQGMDDAGRGIASFDGLTYLTMRDMTPPFESRMVRDEGETVVLRSASGQLVRSWKTYVDHDPGYQVLESPVTDRASWEAAKVRLDPEHPDHLGQGWQARAAQLNEGRLPVMLSAGHSFSIFGYSREMIGDEIYLLFYDDPGLMQEIMDYQSYRMVRLMERVCADVRVDGVFIWEDMAYKGAPLIGPEMFRKFMLEPTRRVCQAARRHGIPCIHCDSDGDITKLMPLWIEAGVNSFEPFEVAAGMDVNRVRSQFGTDVVIKGGFDKRVLAQGRKAIDAEFERLRPAIEAGKYFLTIDHTVPPESTWSDFQYYAEHKARLLEEWAPLTEETRRTDLTASGTQGATNGAR